VFAGRDDREGLFAFEEDFVGVSWHVSFR